MKLIFMDTETTSLNRYKRRIWDLGYIVREPGEDDREEQFFFNVSLKHADPMSLKIGGYYERHPEPYYEFGQFSRDEADVLRDVVDDFRGATLVAGRLALAPPWNYDKVIEMAGLPPIKEEERHTALGDARMVRDLYDWWLDSGKVRP